MATLPETVIKAWENREGPVILTTVDANGVPNAIYATCISLYNAETLVVADNYFSKTRANILAGSLGSVLFMTKDGQAYQIKGHLEYHTTGAVFEDMKRWNPTRHPGHAATALNVEQVYSGSQQLV